MESPAITDEYREKLRSQSEAGTLQELGDLTRNGSECDPELVGHDPQCRGGVEVFLSAHNATTGGTDDRI